MPDSPAGQDAVERRPARLLLVTSLYPTPDSPATGAFVAARAAALRSRGVAVDVVAAGDYRQSAARRHAGMLRRALVERGRFDGVEAHVLFPAGAIGYLAARLRRVPVVVYAHGADVYEVPYRSPIHRLAATWVARHADAVVTNSQATAADVRRLGRDPAVIPPGFDPARFRPLPAAGASERSAVRRRLGLPDGLVAVYLGAFIARKGADLFAEAVERSGEWCGVMVGAGELERLIEAGHPHVLRRHPVPAAEVPAWLQAADVVVAPSRREPLGMAAVEALACGTPVVASDTGGLREVVRDEENGLLVPPGDAVALAAALDRLAADPALLDRLRSGAAVSIASHAMPQVAERMAALWRGLGVRA